MGSVTAKSLQRSPIVMNIYGRANNQVLQADQHNNQLNLSPHQVVSYSIQRSVAGASGTHVFISDADTTDKIEEQMFNTCGGRRVASSFGEDIDLGTEVSLCLPGVRLQKNVLFYGQTFTFGPLSFLL